MSVAIITTGGTIGALPYADPRHPPVHSAMPPPEADPVRGWIWTQNPDLRVVSMPPCDSKAIDQTYRDRLIHLITTSPETTIIVTHGTDRIIETAGHIYGVQGAEAELAKKTVLLVGSMTPLANGPASDGYANLDLALTVALHPERHPKMPRLGIVLHGFADELEADAAAHDWMPMLIAYEPGQYEKFHDHADGRRSRLRKIMSGCAEA